MRFRLEFYDDGHRDSSVPPLSRKVKSPITTTFEDFIAEVEAEAREQGPDAMAELEAFRRYCRSDARQR